MKKLKARFKKTSEPEKKLIAILKKHSGRDRTGKIVVRHQGGRQKRYYRMIDFTRDTRDVKGTVIAIEYDPNRSSEIALVEYEAGERRYILAPVGLIVGSTVIAGDNVDFSIGNALPLKNIPIGTEIHNIELHPGSGGKLAKSAGSYAVLSAKAEEYADLKLPSKEVRKVRLECYATIGRIGNVEHRLQQVGKAGRNRLRGIRPTVRGVAQHPASHPHGGGEGRSGQGMHPKTYTGKSARGTRTRKSKWSDRLIVARRA